MNSWYILIFIFSIFIVIGFIIFLFSEQKTHSKNYKRNKVSKKTMSTSSLSNKKEQITNEEKKELLENTKKIIKENSEAASKVIRNWLKE